MDSKILFPFLLVMKAFFLLLWIIFFVPFVEFITERKYNYPKTCLECTYYLLFMIGYSCFLYNVILY